jgi:signal transduction histidine kinase
MWRLRISMRWWLALAFALIAALTASVVVLVSSSRTSAEFRERSEDLAAGSTVTATQEIRRALADDTLLRDLPEIGADRGLSLFVFSADGGSLSPPSSRGVELGSVPDWQEALTTALDSERFVRSYEDGAATVVALPLTTVAGTAVVLAYAPRPGSATSLGIFRRQIVTAALIAFPIGAAAGLVVALLISVRLRRIAATAAAIEAGSFDAKLDARFRDELGELALTVDRMRSRLSDSFAQLQIERDRLNRLLERLQQGVVTVRHDLRVEYANAAACEMLGVESLERSTLPDPWPDLPLPVLASALFRPDAQTIEARTSPRDEQTYAVVGLPARSPGEAAMLVLTDITDSERRERAEREFVANAAHELRTPLTAITGAVDALDAGAEEDPEARRRFLGHIRNESERLGRLVHALLLLARAQTRQQELRLAPIPLGPLLEDVAARIKPRDGVLVAATCTGDSTALSERDLLEQVVLNLASNAAKHTQRGTIELAAAQAGESVVITVTDSGSGISWAERERIFDRFYRGGERDADGFGLGLAIVREAVHALGGTVSVRSHANSGTTVTVTLPGASPRVSTDVRPAPVRAHPTAERARPSTASSARGSRRDGERTR